MLLWAPYNIAINNTHLYTAIVHAIEKQQLKRSLDALKETLFIASRKTQKNMTLMVYIAADNDLHIFAWKNIRQLAEIAPDNVNILVFLSEPGKNRRTQIYLIEKDRSTLLNKDNTLKLDSGNPETLVNFCRFCAQAFPATEYGLFLWNHGTGIIDPFSRPYRHRLASPSELFAINPTTLQFEVDRTISFLDYIKTCEEQIEIRGLCFDNTYGSYLTNEKLAGALRQIHQILNKKLLVIGMDACLMAMIEVANLVRDHAEYLVASQEVELGAGWRYDKVMKYFLTNPSPKEFPNHIVKAYKDAYEKINQDYTLSAIDLVLLPNLEQSLDQLSQLLITCMTQQSGNSVKNAVQMSKQKIGFDEIAYIDLHSFLERLINNTQYMKLKTNEQELKQALVQKAQDCQQHLKACVKANTAGKNVQYANGLSIYFPEKLDPSYERTPFAKSNNWFNFIIKYIAT